MRNLATKRMKEPWIHQLDGELFRYCGPIFVAPALNSYPEQMIGNGTYALIDTGVKRLLITCCHVWDEYEKCHDTNPDTILAVSLGDGDSNIAFKNPLHHRISIDRDLDLAVFEFEPKEIKVPHNKSWFKISQWPIPQIQKGIHMVTLGFPGKERKASGVHCTFTRVILPFSVTDVSTRSIAAFACKMNRQVLNDLKDSFGGFSGSPAYCLDKNGHLSLVGFTKIGPKEQAALLSESSLPAVFFTHASFLQPNGSLSQ